MKTVIGWLKFSAIVCSVASGSVVNEGRRMTAAGLPPSSLSVNAFLILKGNFRGERVSMVIVHRTGRGKGDNLYGGMDCRDGSWP